MEDDNPSAIEVFKIKLASFTMADKYLHCGRESIILNLLKIIHQHYSQFLKFFI